MKVRPKTFARKNTQKNVFPKTEIRIASFFINLKDHFLYRFFCKF